MGSALHLLKEIDEGSKCMVYGYCQQYEKQASLESNNINFNIPSSIIDIILLYCNTKIFETNYDECCQEFDDEAMGLKQAIYTGAYVYGFEKPSFIQQRAIIPMIKGRDSIIQSHSGTGKTGIFVIASIQIIDLNESQCQVLILQPTRELALQTHHVIQEFASGITRYHRYYNALTTRTCIDCDEMSCDEDKKAFSNGVQIIVGTPLKTHDMVSHGFISLNMMKLFILDEVDVLLSNKNSFREKIADLKSKYVPSRIQIAILSATMPKEILQIAAECMTNPVRFLVKNEELMLEAIKQFHIEIDSEKGENKLKTFIDLYESLTIRQMLIYCNTKQTLYWLHNEMNNNDNISNTVSLIHDGMNKNERDLIMKELRSGSFRVLITNDIMSRGIDVYSIDTIINYDLSIDCDTYIHRIGRCSRYGRRGVVINFVCNDEDKAKIKEIETCYNTKINELPNEIDSIY